jgi:hypothetical protein
MKTGYKFFAIDYWETRYPFSKTYKHAVASYSLTSFTLSEYSKIVRFIKSTYDPDCISIERTSLYTDSLEDDQLGTITNRGDIDCIAYRVPTCRVTGDRHYINCLLEFVDSLPKRQYVTVVHGMKYKDVQSMCKGYNALIAQNLYTDAKACIVSTSDHELYMSLLLRG